MGRIVSFPGIDKDLQKILDADMEEAPARRRARDAFKHIQLGIDHILFKSSSDGLKIREGENEENMAEDREIRSPKVKRAVIFTDNQKNTGRTHTKLMSYEVNSKGLEIFTKSWLPGTSSPRAVVCYCHGYGDTCTFFFEGIARKLASSGYAVFAMDYPGFGLSEGLHCYIPSFDGLVDDVIEHFSKVREDPTISTLPSFLFGQSMGGAVALKVHLKQPNAWNGAILVAPMCKIADNMVPPLFLKRLLIGVANFLPTKKLVPQKDLAEAAFRESKKRELTAYNVIAYKDKPRLKTALEMLKTTQEIEQRLEEVSLPLLILHGEADIVTDPSVSKALYEKARISDKKLKFYKDAYHSLLEGEPDDIITQVFNDIISWLDEHSK